MVEFFCTKKEINDDNSKRRNNRDGQVPPEEAGRIKIYYLLWPRLRISVLGVTKRKNRRQDDFRNSVEASIGEVCRVLRLYYYGTRM